jgi:hypothetical protein
MQKKTVTEIGLKSVLWIVLLCGLIFAEGCKNIDPVLVTELRKDASELDSLGVSLRWIEQERNMNTERAAATDTTLHRLEFGLDSIIRLDSQLIFRLKAYKPTLDSVATGYESGQITTDKARPIHMSFIKMMREKTDLESTIFDKIRDIDYHLDTLQVPKTD